MTITYERRAMRFYFKWKEECTEQTNEAWELFTHGKIDQAELVKRVAIPFLINEIREAVEEKERCAKLCDARCYRCDGRENLAVVESVELGGATLRIYACRKCPENSIHIVLRAPLGNPRSSVKRRRGENDGKD